MQAIVRYYGAPFIGIPVAELRSFFMPIEIVLVYVGGGESAQQFERCKQEWCVIALRYSPRTLTHNFENFTHAAALNSITRIEADGSLNAFTEPRWGESCLAMDRSRKLQ